MKPILIALLAGSMSLTAGAALANNGNGKGNGHGNSHKSKGNVVQVTPTASCPPGLAKKNPPCVPPGQAKKYNPGQYINDYTYIRNPGNYGLNNGYYVTAGNYVYRINKDTREVLNLVGAVADILN
ncbi:hypothetical protein [Marinibacterium sp. SX1]|uniref:hypothetical protein n=1 Tax=Marinibacterium sp. SX1 TaxID=3388424 RepID=UPI003D16A98B